MNKAKPVLTKPQMVSRWGTMSEEELLQTAFTTDNPEGLAGLVDTVPSLSEQPPFVELWYDFRGSKRDRVRCVHCGWHNHLAGYVIKTAEGQRFLVGHDCGDKLYGADFEVFKRDYDDARNHASNLRRWHNLLEALPALLEWLSELEWCEQVKAYRDVKKAFRAELPRLYGEISVAVLHGQGVLSVDERLRDFEAENRAVDRYERDQQEWESLTTTERKNRRRYDGEKAPQPPQLPIYKYVPKPVVTVRASNFFSVGSVEGQPQPHERLTASLRAFQNLAAEIAGATARNAAYQGKRDGSYRDHRHLFATTFQGVFSRVNEQVEQIRAAVNNMAELQAFFSHDSLSAVVGWANQHRKIEEKFELRAGGIASTNPPRGPVSLPKEFGPPSLEGLDKFIEAVNKTAVRPKAS